MKPITVLLADDHKIVRKGIKQLLEMEADIKIVGEAVDGKQAVTFARKLRPNVILMDMAMPGLNGLDATRQILQIHSLHPPKVIIVSAYCNDLYVIAALEAGAQGYLIKHHDMEHIATAIRAVQQGDHYLSSSIPKRLHQTKTKAMKQHSAARLDNLSRTVSLQLPRP